MSTALREPPAPAAAAPAEPAAMPRPGHPLAHLVTALCLWAALLAGMASLHGVVEGHGWLWNLWFPLLLVHGTGAAVRASRLPVWLAPLACLLVAAGCAWFSPALADPGLGGGRGQRFGQLVHNANLEFATQVPQVAYTAAVDFTFLLLGLVLAVLVETLTSSRRLALLVVLPLAFAPVLASLFKLSGAGTGYLLIQFLAMIGYATFLPYRYRRRPSALPGRRQLGFSGLLVLVAAVVLVASSTWMPGFRQGMFPEGTRPTGELFASNIDPLLNLGRDLRSNGNSTLLSYYTSAPAAPYLRTDVIQDLSAARWEPQRDPQALAYSGNTVLRDQYMSFGAKQEVTQLSWDPVPRNLQLPLPQNSYLIQGLQGTWRWQPQTAIASFTRESRQQTGSVLVTHSVPELNPELARNFAFFESRTPPLDEQLTRLPEDGGGAVHELLAQNLRRAFEANGTPGSDFDKAVAIQNYLRSTRFSYSEQTPLREGYDGANMKVVAAFLERRQGYCVHFASTMALLARQAGIPSRIAVGFAPGEATGQSITLDTSSLAGMNQDTDLTERTLNGYRVSGQDAHAWPELYLPGLGWTPFEPTPGRGVTPDYAPVPRSEPAPDPTLNDNRALEETPPSSTPAPTGQATETTPGPGEQRGWPAATAWLLLPAAALGLLIAPLLRASVGRRRLEVAQQGGAAGAGAVWEELRALGADYQQPLRSGETEAAYCARLAAQFPAAGPPLARLDALIERSFYAAQHPGAAQGVQAGQDLAVLAQRMRDASPWGLRLRALAWPASLRGTPAPGIRV